MNAADNVIRRINSKNRDRRGGHKGTYISGDEGKTFNTPKQREFMKRAGKKQLRRDHAKAIAEGLSQYDKDEQRTEWEEEKEYFDERSREEYRQYLNGYPDDDYHYDTYGDDYDDYEHCHGYESDYDDHYDRHDVFDEPRRSGYARIDDVIITDHHVGESLGALMKRFLNSM